MKTWSHIALVLGTVSMLSLATGCTKAMHTDAASKSYGRIQQRLSGPPDDRTRGGKLGDDPGGNAMAMVDASGSQGSPSRGEQGGGLRSHDGSAAGGHDSEPTDNGFPDLRWRDRSTLASNSSSDTTEEHVSELMVVQSAASGSRAYMGTTENSAGRMESTELNDVFFGYDRWLLSEAAQQRLSANAEWLKANVKRRVVIEGHCDERGTQDYNLVLGEKRAKAVRDYLGLLGIEPSRVTVVSYGKERPFCAEHTEQCYQQNRRGHIVVRTQ
jgi:peptidoglycan-associated lipoprotein